MIAASPIAEGVLGLCEDVTRQGMPSSLIQLQGFFHFSCSKVLKMVGIGVAQNVVRSQKVENPYRKGDIICLYGVGI